MTPVIEVVLGLILLYLVLSLVASAINEGIAGFFGWRSTYLERGIRSLIGNLTGAFYDHDLIGTLRNEGAVLPFNRKPSYVSASTFVDTVLDMVRQAEPPADGTIVAGPGPSSLNAVAPGDALLADIRNKLRAAELAGQQYPELGQVFGIFAREAKDFDGFRKKAEAWYDEAMQRVSGWYKRFTRLALFVIGILLAISVNADTINVGNTLWRDQHLREAVADEATTLSNQSQPTTTQARTELKTLENLGLPVGWKVSANNPRPHGTVPWVVKVLGWLITGVAVTFGAPFWFDLLKKFVGLRSSGDPTSGPGPPSPSVAVTVTPAAGAETTPPPVGSV